jgi:DNA (cytosine-5)-methyltransferase 1
MLGIGQTGSGAGRIRTSGDPLSTLVTKAEQCIVQPFIVPHQAQGANRSLLDPIPTITTQTRGMGVLMPFLATVNHGTPDGGHARRAHGIDAPLGTLTTSHGLSLIRPFLIKYYGTGSATAIETPMDTVTTDDRFGLVRPVLVEAGGERYLLDILFRMLTPAELAAAHSFPVDYRWCGNKSEIVKQIGNSVPVRTAMSLCGSQLAQIVRAAA